MDGFKKGPAKIKEDKNGNYIVSMEFNSGSMIEFLEIDNKRAKVVEEDIDSNTKVFEFELKRFNKETFGKNKSKCSWLI